MTDTIPAKYLSQPPEFDGSDDRYSEWLSLLAMWLTMTSIAKKKQAMTIVLSLKGRARSMAAELSIADLEDESDTAGSDVGLGSSNFPAGVIHLIKTLNEGGYLKSQHMLSFSALDEFFKLHGSTYSSMMEYTTAFSTKLQKAKSTSGLTINDSAVAMMMLLRSGLPKEEFARVLGSAGPAEGLTPAKMKTTLHYLFPSTNLSTTTSLDPNPVFHSGSDLIDAEDAIVDILEETISPTGEQVFLSRQVIFQGKFPGRNRATKSGTIPPRDLSKIQCFGCGQFGHYRSSCTARRSDSKPFFGYPLEHSDFSIEKVTLFSEKDIENVYLSFPPDTTSVAILDSACSCSVMGSTFLRRLREMYPNAIIQRESSATMFEFGQTRKSAIQRVILPVIIGMSSGFILVEVVLDEPGHPEFPLLLSKSTMTRLQISINFGNNTGTILGRCGKFSVSDHGHYILPIQLGSHSYSEGMDVFSVTVD